MGIDWPKVDVAYVVEATYPYQRGGVASIIHGMIEQMPELSFGVIHIAWDRRSHGPSAYPLPPQVKWVYDLYLSPIEQDKLPRAPWFGFLPLQKARRRALVADFIATMKELGSRNAAKIKAAFLHLTSEDAGLDAFWKHYNSRECLEILRQECDELGITVTDLFWMQREFFAILHALLNRRYPPAAIYHAHIQLSGGLAAILAASQHQGRSVLTEHGLYVRDSINYLFKRCASHEVDIEDDLRAAKSDPHKSAWIRWFLALGRAVYELVDVETYQYERHIEAALRFGAQQDKAVLISNGLDSARFSQARECQKTRQVERQREGFVWRLAYMGRIVGVKGITELIRAVAMLLAEDLPPFQLDVVGPASEEPHYLKVCQDLVLELGLSALVNFTGSKDLAVALEDTDIMILPSYSEALPIVILEAMTASVPVVGTDTGSIEEILARPVAGIGAAGLVVPVRDARALAQAIKRLILEPDLYRELHRNGPLRIMRSHQASDVIGAYRRLYDSLGMNVFQPRQREQTSAALCSIAAGN